MDGCWKTTNQSISPPTSYGRPHTSPILIWACRWRGCNIQEETINKQGQTGNNRNRLSIWCLSKSLWFVFVCLLVICFLFYLFVSRLFASIGLWDCTFLLLFIVSLSYYCCLFCLADSVGGFVCVVRPIVIEFVCVLALQLFCNFAFVIFAYLFIA